MLFLLLLPCSSIASDSGKTTKTIAVKDISVSQTGPVGLEILASSPGASWAKKGAEAAAITVKVDGTYDQDLLLYGGEEPTCYRILLGALKRGEHRIELLFNPDRSAKAVKSVTVVSVTPIVCSASETPDCGAIDKLAKRNAPVIYARANSIDRFTDVPLLMFYEVLKAREGNTIIRYSVVFTNEDGGTPSAALMARWGRATDIEWVYEIELSGEKIIQETYQGVEHETKPFKGQRTADGRPLLADASDNNNFSDAACSVMRFAPLPACANLERTSREVVMDEAPWTYRVMADELAREGRISSTLTTANTIADPRSYLYVEAYSQTIGAAMAFGVSVADNKSVFRSDLGDARLRIDRSGFFRTAIRLPERTSTSRLSSLSIECLEAGQKMGDQVCSDISIKKVFVLDEKFVPQPVGFEVNEPLTLHAGESATATLVGTASSGASVRPAQ